MTPWWILLIYEEYWLFVDVRFIRNVFTVNLLKLPCKNHVVVIRFSICLPFDGEELYWDTTMDLWEKLCGGPVMISSIIHEEQQLKELFTGELSNYLGLYPHQVNRRLITTKQHNHGATLRCLKSLNIHHTPKTMIGWLTYNIIPRQYPWNSNLKNNHIVVTRPLLTPKYCLLPHYVYTNKRQVLRLEVPGKSKYISKEQSKIRLIK